MRLSAAENRGTPHTGKSYSIAGSPSLPVGALSVAIITDQVIPLSLEEEHEELER